MPGLRSECKGSESKPPCLKGRNGVGHVGRRDDSAEVDTEPCRDNALCDIIAATAKHSGEVLVRVCIVIKCPRT